MIKLLASLIVILSILLTTNISAQESGSFIETIDLSKPVSDEQIKELIPAYQGTNVKEVEYYTNGKIEQDAKEKFEQSEDAQIIKVAKEKSEEFTINPNEDWLKNSKEAQKNPESYVSVITGDYQDCNQVEKSCIISRDVGLKECLAKRVIDAKNYYQYSCHKDKENYNLTCKESLKVKCAKSSKTLPQISNNSFQAIHFDGNYLYLGKKVINNISHNCSGYNFELDFDINHLENLEEFTLVEVWYDDKVKLSINDKLAFSGHGDHGGCELGGDQHYSTNVNLKSLVKQGQNKLKAHLVVGGAGQLWLKFKISYHQCQQYEENKWQTSCDFKYNPDDSCIQASKLCTQKNESRDIGQNVKESKDCWEYKVNKECAPAKLIDYCQPLYLEDECNQTGLKCLEYENDQCINFQKDYQCKNNNYEFPLSKKIIYVGASEEIVSEYINYSSCKSFENNQYCTLDSQKCLDQNDKNINGQLFQRDCWQYKRSYSCASSANQELESCHILDQQCHFNHSICQELDSDNQCIAKQRFYDCPNNSTNADIAICGSQTYCDEEDCYKEGISMGNAAAILGSISQAASDLNSEVGAFHGTTNKCSKDPISYSNCCNLSGWGDDILGAEKCTTSEKDLARLKSQGLCVYIGEYCSKEEKITGLCLKESQSYCCYNNKLSKIINQQARPQLDISWGSAENPNCSGLVVEDLQRIDFISINFSEVEVELEQKALNISPKESDVVKQAEDFISNTPDQIGGDQ